jgi:glycosyltransferase involved in cell wall biosynthesis
MRILLTSNASHVPPRGGSTRSNLVWLEYLEARGHDCRIVAPALARDTPQSAARIAAELDHQRIRVHHIKTDPKLGFEILKQGEITVYSVQDPARLRVVLGQKIQRHQPDWVLVSSEDLGQGLLQEAHLAAPGRVIYLAHTPQMFPFGPASLNPRTAGAELVARCAAIVAIGSYTADYIEKHLGRRPTVIHPPVYGPAPYPRRDPDADGLITLINASAVKGISIFLALARRFPAFAFGALHGWGTTEEDFRALRQLPNVTLLPKVKHIEAVLNKTKILLVPSLWSEGFGLVVMQAMLMGVPVVASNLGSLVEAKAGTRYVLPVRPIERYRTVFDENRMPEPIIPVQDIEPWAEALTQLMTDPQFYRRESDAAREAALCFVESVRAAQFEEFLLGLTPSPMAREPVAGTETPRHAMTDLSAERRALLLRKVKEKTRQRP